MQRSGPFAPASRKRFCAEDSVWSLHLPECGLPAFWRTQRPLITKSVAHEAHATGALALSLAAIFPRNPSRSLYLLHFGEQLVTLFGPFSS